MNSFVLVTAFKFFKYTREAGFYMMGSLKVKIAKIWKCLLAIVKLVTNLLASENDCSAMHDAAKLFNEWFSYYLNIIRKFLSYYLNIICKFLSYYLNIIRKFLFNVRQLLDLVLYAKAYLGTCEISMMELLLRK